MEHAIYEILTYEQKQKVDEILQKKYILDIQNCKEKRLKKENISRAWITGYFTVCLITLFSSLFPFYTPTHSPFFDTIMAAIIVATGIGIFFTVIMIFQNRVFNS